MDSSLSKKSRGNGLLLLIIVLATVLGFIFSQSFNANLVLFSNDGPLGAMKSEANKMPHPLFGNWQDLNWVGNEIPSPSPNFSTLLLAATSPETYLKIHAPASLLLLGLSAWLFLRQLGFPGLVCAMAGLAAALNGNMVSNAGWGQISRPLSLATTFLALAAIHSAFTGRLTWIKLTLAGLAVGLGVSEGFDVGVLYSFVVSAYVVFLALRSDGSLGEKSANAAGRVALIAVFAGLIAAQTMTTLLGTQLKGAVGGEQSQMTREEKWVFLTQWSTPKLETLGVIIPGLFGYASTTPGEKNYWGKVGQTPGAPQSRFNGSGEYAGVLVALLAVFAIAQSFRRNKPIFSSMERALVWFWSATALISLLLAFGRHAPFYQLIHQLPFFSSMRNPMKFMHIFHLAWIILFGFGLCALYREYLEKITAHACGFKEQFKKWWSKAGAFEKKWIWCSIGAVVMSLIAWLIYSSMKPALVAHLESVGMRGDIPQIAAFSIRAVGYFVLFLLLSVATVIAMMSGWFSGTRVKWAGMIFCVLLVADLGRAAQPWIIYWNAKHKYASNPVIEIMRDNPHLRRVTLVPVPMPQMSTLQSVYGIEWLQQLFQYYNIQSLDVIQEPRPPADTVAFKKALGGNISTLVRYWELTNTRFLLGLSGDFIEALNQQLDPSQRRFRLHTAFDIVPKPGVDARGGVHPQDLTAVINPQGTYALIEFTGALPRVKLYSEWRSLSDKESLNTLAQSDFNPHKSVLVPPSSVPNPSQPETDPGTVEFISYSPKHIVLKANVKTQAVLLLNDKFNPHWKANVDEMSVPVFRANYLMRGVYLEPGEHQIEFVFRPPLSAFYISMGAIVLGIALCGIVVYLGRRRDKDSTLT